MHTWLAAILLLPASWRVYCTPRAWLTAFATGPNHFFSMVIKNAPLYVRRSPVGWRNVFVYWPMKAGIDLVRSKSVQSTLRNGWRRFRYGAPVFSPSSGPKTFARGRQLPHISSDEIKGMMRAAGTKVVSFDIFDTLLVRPMLRPKDIFYLIAAKVNAQYDVDFVKMRWNAEEETGKPNATIHDIYAYIQQQYNLTANIAQALLDEEVRCESALLAPREDMRPCYDEAVTLGKRIIAVSDMYLPADIVGSILQKAGYTHIAALYVSCAHGKRKSDGTLYDYVIAEEHIHPSEMLHIGDNYDSDYCAALKRYVTAVYCPLPLAEHLKNAPDFAALIHAAVHKNPFWSQLLGFALHRLCAKGIHGKSIVEVPDVATFAELTIAPLLTGYCLTLAGNTYLHHAYERIYFASRDGYLPHKVYATIGQYVPCLPAVYFYAGRRAYYPFLYDSFSEYAASLKTTGDTHHTLHDFVIAHFSGSDILQRIEENLSDKEKALSFLGEQKRCIRILERFESAIESFMHVKRSRSKKYYATVFPIKEGRVLVFDMGYSGSIGQALSAATGKTVDKLYFWETPANKKCDKDCGSRTNVFMQDASGCIPINILFEETFSPCEGGVVGFDANSKPILEDIPLNHVFQRDMDEIHGACLDFAVEFCTRFGEYAQYVRPNSGTVAVDVCHFLLHRTPYCNQRLFKNIMFPDPLHYAELHSLERKLDNFLPYNTVFAGTGFDDPRLALVPKHSCASGLKLGMHIHVHNVLLTDEIIRYLRDVPVPLDIYVTITDKDAERTVRQLFTQARIPHVQNVVVLSVPNRGRDIAPWILGMRPYQQQYDLFCHIHAKESSHFDFGATWRCHLFNNILLPDAMEGVLALFHQNPTLGCIFPPVFPPLAAFMTARDIPPSGLKGECQLAEDLVHRMGLRGEICRSDLFFSVGSMLWYRPEALHQLFTFTVAWEDFPAEPIGVEGTIAHAIERLPALIAARNGYQVGTFAKHT